MVDRQQALRDAEQWFVRHGLPYFVQSEREIVQRGLSRNRLVPVLGLALLVGAVVGVGTGLWLDVPAGLAAGLCGLGVVLAFYAATTLRLRVIARWAVGRTLGSLGLMFPLVTRALPLLMLFITFLFINTEVWMVANSLDPGVLTMAVMFFAAMAVGFLLVRLPEEMDRVDDDTDTGRLVARTQGTPVGHCSREVFDEIPEDELRGVLEVGGLQKWNLVLVLLVSQFVQVLLLSVAVLAVLPGLRQRRDAAGRGRVLAPGQGRRRRGPAAQGLGVPGRLLGALLHRLRRDRRDLPPAVLHLRHP